jgi:hypothetical protein
MCALLFDQLPFDAISQPTITRMLNLRDCLTVLDDRLDADGVPGVTRKIGPDGRSRLHLSWKLVEY